MSPNNLWKNAARPPVWVQNDSFFNRMDVFPSEIKTKRTKTGIEGNDDDT
ncbi:hypothetical protein WDW89_14375 [Deltaproteobacteria bacterium TL4]